ncbi:hypothetical protein ISF_04264 [Cordyceps fumosorosea ARSEF 2679]|uniref:Uncharacterized protein n=1 Tax=Cordyceps fumosorosea (strain ARSEF 2679) TaxID=1081104 RepID=A0A167XDS0_CORFA|nr:hypothetical protein ISF_04264 [Cordyceps fumosorosea ARSEF 2679]OAA64854.1 hypothetical protein ISF_04264 [Cordyceps fumosorosea ARSEF 2679]
MPENEDIAAIIQDGLNPYIKPREQVSYIRRILAAHLAKCTQGSALTPTLALANGRDAGGLIKTDSTTENTIYRDYLEALKENVAAKKDFEEARQYAVPGPPRTDETATSATSSGLHERVALLKLHQKRDSLYAVQETLDTLLEQPAADPEFLDAERVFHGVATALPPVPRDVTDAMVVEQSSSAPLDIPAQIGRLEKVVLRAKLLLMREEQLLQEARQQHARRRRGSSTTQAPPSQATRDELIAWIETELGKASPETAQAAVEDGEGGSSATERGGVTDPAAIQEQLATIRDKYDLYVSSRRLLLEMAAAASGSQPLPPPSRNAKSTKRTSYALAAPPRPPTDHLIAPYLAALVETSASHKATVAYRTHASALVNRTAQEHSRQVGKLAEESHLLSAFPSQRGASPHHHHHHHHRSGVDATGSQGGSIASQVQPWVDAADAAKMATLESVAETLETGQAALEGLMSTLQGIGEVTGKDVLGGGGGEEGRSPAEEDTWLAETPRAKRHARKGSKVQPQSSTDPWSRVRGNLGLLGQEGP